MKWRIRASDAPSWMPSWTLALAVGLAPPLELWDDVLGEVGVSARGNHVPEVETVGIGGGDPFLDAIGDLGAGPDRERPGRGLGEAVDDVAQPPVPVAKCLGQ